MILRGIIGLIFLSFFGGVYSQFKSTFNNRIISVDRGEDYSFIISGHFYGDGSNKTGYPANTLLANLDWINNSDAEMLVCLGDLFMDIKKDMPFYEASLFSQLQMPLVNAVGNHDLTGNVYEENYGKTFYKFQLGSDIHLVLDTELDDGNIEGSQLDLLNSIKDEVKDGQINNVFIYMHRTIWSDAYYEMEGLFVENTQSITATNYKQEVLPILNEIANESSLYLFSGSLGPAPASFFYFKDEEHNFDIIATAIRAMPRDALLLVDVIDGQTTFRLQSLTGETLNPLESYNIGLWQNSVGKPPFNWRLVPLYFKNMLTHRYFWYGITYTTLGIVLLLLFWKRRLRKKIEQSKR